MAQNYETTLKDRKKEPSVVLIPTNYNGASITFKTKTVLWHCFDSLKRTHWHNMHIILGDDSSTDNSIVYMQRNFPKIPIIVNKPNGGYTKNANNAARYALKKYNPDYIVLMNNDIIIKDPDWLAKMINVAESDDKIGIVGCKFLYPDGRLQHAGIKNIGPIIRSRGWNTNLCNKYNNIEEMPAVGGVVFVLKRDMINKIGLLDENYYMGSDDVDYCIAARKAGFKVIYDGEVSVIHLEGLTSKNVAKIETKDLEHWFPIFQLNNIYFAFKNFSTTQKLAAIGVAFLSCVLSIGNREMKISNIKFKDKELWRLLVTLRAIIIGYKLSKHIIGREEAYRDVSSK